MLETPRQLLEALREAAGNPPILADVLSEEEAVGILTAVGFPPEEARARARELGGVNLAQGMLEDAISRAPRWFQDALSDETQLVAGALFTNDLNAEALRAANGGWLLLINQGLMLFAYKFARVIACQSEPRDDGEPQVEAGLAYSELEQVFSSLALRGVPVGGDVPLSRNQFRAATSLTVAAEHFVLSHELGHHTLGHLDGGDVGHFRFRSTDVAVARMDWQEELAADAIALGCLVPSLSAAGDRSITAENRQAFGGIFFLFQILDLYEDLMDRFAANGVVATQDPRQTHPPPQDRFNALAGIALAELGGDTTAYSDLAATCRAIKGTIGSFAGEADRRRKR